MLARKTAVSGPSADSEACDIRDVWAWNLMKEFGIIVRLMEKYSFVSIDTEFPGIVVRPIGEFSSIAEYQYQLLRCNVDQMKIIQLGLSLMDENGNTPPECSTWQFNFHFDLDEDMYAQDFIDMLVSCGIQFRRHKNEGIDHYLFAQLLVASGVLMSRDINWISFHSGYDFAYVLKMITNRNLPREDIEFYKLLRTFFPEVYDVKYLVAYFWNFRGGLQDLADLLALRRVGPQYQAGGDSLLTGQVFLKVRELFFEDYIDYVQLRGRLYGVGPPCVGYNHEYYNRAITYNVPHRPANTNGEEPNPAS